MRARGSLVFAALLTAYAPLLACSSDSASPAQAGSSGAGSGGGQSDGSVQDAADGSPDVDFDGSSATDSPADAANETAIDALDESAESAPPDSAQEGASCVAQAGLGQLTCTCDELNAPLDDGASAFLFEDLIDFGIGGWDSAKLTAGGQQILAEGNLNDGSLKSEITAYEVLSRCDRAQLLKTERGVSYYDKNGKKTDLVVQIDGHKVGVSVVRAYHYPPSNPYTLAEAQETLTGKLADLPLAASNAKPEDVWERSLLAVIAWDQQYADEVTSAWNGLGASERGNVIMIVTVTDGDDSALY
jgi:hypothetical protein